jgi:HK97 family phage major capsid protein/HK97 family phage prohead protease
MEQQVRQAPPTGERLSRVFAVEKRAVDEEARTVELAFSSEYGVDRGWGLEVLEHSERAMRLDRMRDGGPVLVEHNPKDHVGTVVSVELGSDRKARAVVKFGRSSRAAEVFQDVTDGIKSKVSVGYMVHKWEVDEDNDTWRAVDWEPYELSLVSIPADPSVGVGRSAEPNPALPQERSTMSEVNSAPAAPAAPPVDVAAIENQVRTKELKRINDLEAMGQAYAQFGGAELAREHIAAGKSVDDMRVALLERVKVKAPPSAEIGLTQKEAQRFSIVRAVQAAILVREGKIDDAKAIGGFELEASAAAQKLQAKVRGNITIPYDVLVRDLTTSTGTGTSKAGNLIATDLLAGSFIDVLRNRMVLPTLGAQFMPGLVGNVAIPKQTTATTAYWVAENSAPTEGAPVMGQVTMSPKTVAAFVDISRRLTLQSTPAVEQLMRNDLTASLAVAIDEAGIGTSGTNRPTGVRGTSGIGSVAIGTNGGAPTWASIVNLVREVDIDNALTGQGAYLTNAKVKAKLATTPRQASGVEGNFLLAAPYNELYGYPFVVSNQVPSTLTKGTASGVCSAMFFGIWSDLIIGQWSGIDLLVDPYTGSSAGTVRITAFADVDVAVRRAESFAAVLDYTTT